MSRVYTYTYTYNADGIRTSKTVNGVKHTYTLNGSQIVSEEFGNIYLVYLYDESGSPIGLQYRPSSMVKEIFYTYFFEKNMQGDITAIFKENGAKIGYYSYDAWGNIKASVENSATTLEKSIVQSYNRYYYDTESGLYYLQSRYYNPQWGRFLNADGYVSTGTGMIGYNMYAYCNNNPVMYVDPCGACIHNGVYYGMGRDCPDCLAGITKPEYDKMNSSSTKNSNNSITPEQYYIDIINESTPEPNNSFSGDNSNFGYDDTQNLFSIPLNTFSLIWQSSAGAVTSSTAALMSGMGYFMTTPMSITMHWCNTNLTTGQKWAMTGYETGVAVGGIALTYAIVNFWNPTGPIAFIVALVYSITTMTVGTIMVGGFEEYNETK